MISYLITQLTVTGYGLTTGVLSMIMWHATREAGRLR